MTKRITLVQYETTDPRLGRHVEHDERSRAYPIRAALPIVPKDVFWPDSAPILDQGDLGSCVGFTGADFLNTQYCEQIRRVQYNNKYLTNEDGKKLYHLATLSDNLKGGYPPTDTGSTGLGLAKALKKLGFIRGYEHAFVWEHVVAGIATQPLCMGTLWTRDMFKPDTYGVIRCGSLADSNIAGGHEWMLRGISYTKGLALGRNHWNTTWDKTDRAGVSSAHKVPGEFWLPIADLKKLLANDGDVTRLLI